MKLLAPTIRRAAVASLLFAGLPYAFAQQRASPPQTSDATETHRVLVIPINLQGRTPLALDRRQIVQALFGASDSVASRYRALSYGKVEFAGSDGDILDPLTLAEPADFCNAGMKRLAATAEDEVRRRGIARNAYQHVVFVIPRDAPCWWIGVGDIGGDRVWVKATTTKALQHELGHNLGMNHAVHWRRSDAEGSDFMGSANSGLNAPHVVEMGWLRGYPGKVVELATTAADITLEPLETDPRQSALPKVAIVRPAPGANTYYFSYRAPGSSDPLPDEFTRGLNIHIGSPARQAGGLTYFVTSLSDGAAYADGPMRVQQLAHVAGARVTFRVSFTGTAQAIAAGPPPAPPGTLQSLASGKCLDLPGGKTSDGTPVIQYDCHGGANQQWTVESISDAGSHIVSRMSGKCIATDSAVAAAGGAVVQSPCGTSSNQLWALNDSGNGYVLRNAANRLCLDVPGGSVENGVKPVAWACNGGTNQIWRYVSPTPP